MASITNSAHAKIYYVNKPSQPGIPSQGYDLSTTVELARMNSGIDTIYVWPGIYKLDEELIVEDVIIGGCYLYNTWQVETIGIGTRYNDPQYMTILDGNSFARVMPSLKHRVATVNTGGVIYNCLIRNGHARGTSNNPTDISGFGGGILVNGGNVYNCIIRGNVAMNMAYSSTNPSKGGGVFITDEGGDVVNCIIAFNMDDKGLGVDGNAGALINNTIARNANAPKYVLIPGNDGGIPKYRYFKEKTTTNEFNGPYMCLNDFYMATTETTFGQYACFLSALTTYRNEKNNNLTWLEKSDWEALCAANTPMSGYDKISIAKYLGITPLEINTPPALMYCQRHDKLPTLGVGDESTYGSWQVYYPQKQYPGNSWYSAGKSGNVSYTADPLVRDNFPVTYISWHGAVAFSAWLGTMLPTKAQWEYAARKTDAGSGIQNNATYPGDIADPDSVGWYSENSLHNKTRASAYNIIFGQYGTFHEVAKLAPTKLGLYDMCGNMNEWVCDYYKTGNTHHAGNSVLGTATSVDGAYTVSQDAGGNGSNENAPLYNPIYNYASSNNRIIVGGSWINKSENLMLCSPLNSTTMDVTNLHIGFRTAGCFGCR